MKNYSILPNLVVTAACLAGVSLPAQSPTADEFASVAYQILPNEQLYEYHQLLKNGPVHQWRRDQQAQASAAEMQIPSAGWKLRVHSDAGLILTSATVDFRDYLSVSMGVEVSLGRAESFDQWKEWSSTILVGTRDQLSGCGEELKAAKDYQLIVSPGQIVVCGFDEKGAAHGLYNLEARMNLREGPFLPRNLRTTRHSLYQTRMVLNWMGWMEWSDNYLARLAHDGFDSIYASAYSNPNGADGTAHYVMIRRQDPERMKDLLKRAARFGIGVYTPLLFRYTGEPENEQQLRQLVRDILTELPAIKGFILLTEGFFYEKWFGAGGHGEQDLRAWAREWCHAVGIVVEESRRIKPDFEVLPWEYNIDFRPQQVDVKRYFITQLPEQAIPFLTWENGKGVEIEGYRGYVRDYSIAVVGPAEVTEAQIQEAKRRGMRVYSKADTFASWQFGTTPYLPIPYQWHRRYKALEKHGVDGTHESWSYGYKPNFILEMRAWYCWSEAPPLDELLEKIARRIFGPGSEERVLQAWREFSEAIQLVPDLGPSMGTNFAVANPLFFQKPPPRTMTIEHSWWDQEIWKTHRAARINPLWPFTRNSFTFIPDFSNQVNMAEQYARSRSGVSRVEDPERLEGLRFVDIFNKYLLAAADRLELGLKNYRQAALEAPPAKKKHAFREVVIVEQMQRMLRCEQAILEFEDLRYRLVHSSNSSEKGEILRRMEKILSEEIERTLAVKEAALRDSRLGYEMEMDYLYTPYVLDEKLEVLENVMKKEIPAYRREEGL